MNILILRTKKILTFFLESLVFGYFSEKDAGKIVELVFLLLDRPAFFETSLEILLEYASLTFMLERKDLVKSKSVVCKINEQTMDFAQENFFNLFLLLLESKNINKFLSPSIFIGFIKSKSEYFIQNYEKFVQFFERKQISNNFKTLFSCFFKSLIQTKSIPEEEDLESFIKISKPLINDLSVWNFAFETKENSGFHKKKLWFLLKCLSMSCEDLLRIIEIVGKDDFCMEDTKELNANDQNTRKISNDLVKIFEQTKDSPLKNNPLNLVRMESSSKEEVSNRRILSFFSKERNLKGKEENKLLKSLFKKDIKLFFLPKQEMIERSITNIFTLPEIQNASFENNSEMENFLDLYVNILNCQQKYYETIFPKKTDFFDLKSLIEVIFKTLWNLFLEKGLSVIFLENYLKVLSQSVESEANYLTILLKILEAFTEADLIDERENAVNFHYFVYNNCFF